MQKKIGITLLSSFIFTFLLGGISGYQYHAYAQQKSIKNFFGSQSTATQTTEGFFDYHPDVKKSKS